MKNLIEALKQASCFMDDGEFKCFCDNCNIPKDVKQHIIEYRNKCNDADKEVYNKFSFEFNTFQSYIRTHDKVIYEKSVPLNDIANFIQIFEEITEKTKYVALKKKYIEVLGQICYIFDIIKKNYEKTFPEETFPE